MSLRVLVDVRHHNLAAMGADTWWAQPTREDIPADIWRALPPSPDADTPTGQPEPEDD